jgi:hypothetical protein
MQSITIMLRWLLLAAAFALSQRADAYSRWKVATNCTLQTRLAKEHLLKNNISANDQKVMKDRLLVPILHSHSTNVSELSKDVRDLAYHYALKRAVDTLIERLMPTTALDIFVFLKPRHMAGAPDWLVNNTHVLMLPIHEAGYALPHHLLRPREMGW